MTMITISGLKYKLYLNIISPEPRKIHNYPSLLRKSPNCYQRPKLYLIALTITNIFKMKAYKLQKKIYRQGFDISRVNMCTSNMLDKRKFYVGLL